MSATLTDYIDSQHDLVEEASLALPHQFSKCSYSLGHIRQAVYLCLTCPETRGFCSACSIACHTSHEQIELFPKRNFRCDCPTTAMANPCTLHTTSEPENTSNIYGQNFKGLFCRCGRPYDPNTERETMIQCLACEDWFHESCCNLRERPSSREPSTEPQTEKSDVEEVDNQDDATSQASSSGLPPPLLSASDYDTFVCASCVSDIPELRRLAGTQGVMMVIRDSLTTAWKVLRDSPDASRNQSDNEDPDTVPTAAGTKRSLPASGVDIPEAKRARVASPSDSISISTALRCQAPPPNPVAQRFLLNPSIDSDFTGDLFLTEGWRDRWCRCPSCLPALEKRPFLLEEEDTYEPPEDPDSARSLEELGMRALERLPRDRAIDGIHAFNAMRDELTKYLRPFAQEGKVVNETDVRSFFESLTEAHQKSRH